MHVSEELYTEIITEGYLLFILKYSPKLVVVTTIIMSKAIIREYLCKNSLKSKVMELKLCSIQVFILYSER